MKTADTLVIELSGTPRERGQIYGETAKNLIADIVNQWRADLGNFGQDSRNAKPIDTDAYLQDFLAETHYLKAIKQWTPDLLEEVTGIAEASGQRFDDILGLQLMDEEWIYGLRRRLTRPTHKCTAFGIPHQGESNSYAGQNMDVGSWVDGKQVLLRLMPDGESDSPEGLIFTIAGNLALNGLNANGLGVTCNTLAQLNHSTKGLPVSFMVRALLSKANIKNADTFINSVPHASGQNYILSSHGDMRCFECCGSSVIRYAPEAYQGRVFHSNHPLVNTDVTQPPLVSSPMENTEARLHAICNRLGHTSKPVTFDEVKAALSSHDDPNNPVSRNTNNEGSSIGFTAGSFIYEFGNKTRLHMAAGPPCETAFEVYDFHSGVGVSQ